MITAHEIKAHLGLGDEFVVAYADKLKLHDESGRGIQTGALNDGRKFIYMIIAPLKHVLYWEAPANTENP